MAPVLTDWRGNQFTVGSLVLYPRMSGRSAEIQEATVTDIWMVYRCPENFDWKRLPEGAEPPLGRSWNRVLGDYEMVPAKTELRIKVQPIKSSRNFHRSADYDRWKNPEVETSYREATLTITENVTAIGGV